MRGVETMKEVRVRYAPSPTGELHIGNARTALFNYLFARHHSGKFIIRIEDTDVARNVAGGVESQLKYLSWLGVDWDEGPDIGGPYGPYFQLQRLDLYKEYANKLMDMGLAYHDYREGSEAPAIRMKVPQNVTYTFNDMVRGELKFESSEVEDWILIKDNGIPTYNFAVVIDDHFMKITHVLRGEEHITNTPKQIMLYQAFGWDVPTFGHMTIIVNEEKKKLSKRDVTVMQFLSQYANLGYLPEAMLNFITLLGWSPGGEEEILSKEEIIELFDETRLSKAPAMFDKNKLTYINSRHIKNMSSEAFMELCRPFLVEAKVVIKNEEWLKDLTDLFHDRVSYGAEIVKLYEEFFNKPFELGAEELTLLKETNSKQLIEVFLDEIKHVEFTPETIKELIKKVGKDLGIKGRNLFMPIRIATTAQMHGPSLEHAIYLLERPKIILRLEKTLGQLEEK
jgi:glutamyl-tRNA synthetase/nondiscriminating glutamyl-tRNA synthetase